jgi:phage shock protein E
LKNPLWIVVIVVALATPVSRGAEPAPLPRITPAELQARMGKDDGLVILDVRTPAEFAAGHVPGARNVPHDAVASRLPELTALRDRPVVLYCRSGRRSALAAEQLRAAGFSRLLQLDGDFPGWDAAQRPVQREPAASAPSPD